MLQDVTLPGALSRVLAAFRSCFTAPTFETFTALVAGLLAAPVGRTVCGMLTGAGLAQVWQHCRAHRILFRREVVSGPGWPEGGGVDRGPSAGGGRPSPARG